MEGGGGGGLDFLPPVFPCQSWRHGCLQRPEKEWSVCLYVQSLAVTVGNGSRDSGVALNAFRSSVVWVNE